MSKAEELYRDVKHQVSMNAGTPAVRALLGPRLFRALVAEELLAQLRTLSRGGASGVDVQAMLIALSLRFDQDPDFSAAEAVSEKSLHVHGPSMPCNVMCPGHPNTVKNRPASIRHVL